MKRIIKKQYLLAFILASFLVVVSLSAVYAQNSISGDDVCGVTSEKRCTFTDLRVISGGVIKGIVAVGLPLLVIFIVVRLLLGWFTARKSGSAGAYTAFKETIWLSLQAVLGLLIVVALFGGLFLTMLKFVGVADFPLKLLKIMNSSSFLVSHAYAQTTGGMLPNGTIWSDIVDFFTSAVRLVMRIFVYPALIVMWVWTGFSFVTAQGNPNSLKDAKRWFWYAVVTTIAIMLVQVFLLAIRGSVEKIIPGKSAIKIKRDTPPLSFVDNRIV